MIDAIQLLRDFIQDRDITECIGELEDLSRDDVKNWLCEPRHNGNTLSQADIYGIDGNQDEIDIAIDAIMTVFVCGYPTSDTRFDVAADVRKVPMRVNFSEPQLPGVFVYRDGQTK